MFARGPLPSPIGRLTLVASDHALVELHFPDRPVPDAVDTPVDDHPILAWAARELTEYFAGDRQRFTVPVAGDGTPFQRQVWTALQAIQFAETCGYGELARAIGRPSAARAVGAANGANPIPILVPCHRVVGATGALVGFAGGLPIKRWLLAHEATIGARQRRLAL